MGQCHLGASQRVWPIPRWRRAPTSNIWAAAATISSYSKVVDQAPEALRFFEGNARVPFYMVDKLPDHIIQPGKGQSRSGEAIRCAPLSASLGSWQKHLDLTPYRHGGGVTFEEMQPAAAWRDNGIRHCCGEREAKDIRTFGGALAGYFLKGRHRPRHPDKD